MDITIQIRNYRKGVELRYIDASTGEIIYDMVIAPIETFKLSDIISGAEKMHAGRYDNARISWDVKYDE